MKDAGWAGWWCFSCRALNMPSSSFLSIAGYSELFAHAAVWATRALRVGYILSETTGEKSVRTQPGEEEMLVATHSMDQQKSDYSEQKQLNSVGNLEFTDKLRNFPYLAEQSLVSLQCVDGNLEWLQQPVHSLELPPPLNVLADVQVACTCMPLWVCQFACVNARTCACVCAKFPLPQLRNAIFYSTLSVGKPACIQHAPGSMHTKCIMQASQGWSTCAFRILLNHLR